MKHLKEYEEADLKDLIDDLEGVGQGGLVGFMWIGSIPKGEHMGFLVVGRDERDCVDMVLSSNIFGNHPLLPYWFKANSGYKGTFVDMLERLFEKGVISDAGHYPDLKARGGKRLITSWYNPYLMNPKYCYDQAEAYFKNADEVFSKEEPESRIWEPK
jgi:hypothetical protein